MVAALPVGKVIATVVRVGCRPVVNKLVVQAASHEHLDRVIIFIGRRYLRFQRGLIKTEAAPMAVVVQPPADGSSPPPPSSPSEVQAEEAAYLQKVAAGVVSRFRKAHKRAAVVEPTEREMREAGAFVLVESLIYGLMIGLVTWEYSNSCAESSAKAAAMEDMASLAAEIASKAAEKIIGVETDIKQAKDVVKSIHDSKAKAA